ncbi:MAG TPA: HAMP domain-containing sensor histidine kinase [Nannocystis sp.]
MSAICVAAPVLAGHFGVGYFVHRRPAAVRLVVPGFIAVVAAALLVAPSWTDAGVWLVGLAVVAWPVGGSSALAGVAALVVAAGAGVGLLIAGASSTAGVAATAVVSVGVCTAAALRRGEEEREAQRRELASVRGELRDLRARQVDGAEGRILALSRANQALQAEVERGRRVLEEALDASRTKTSFLLRISHELRTPLNAIVGYTELLLEHGDDAGRSEQRADLERILGAAHELLALIDSVLDLARLEAGKFEVQIEEFSLRELVHEAIAAVRPQAERGGNTLKLKLSRELGTIRSDRTRLRQILVQLLGNACKFTSGGLIELRVEPLVTPAGPAYALSVRDTGVGIEPDYLPKLFTPFSQADDSPTRRFGGLGVGLALCKHYCTLLGGDISAESEPGKGSVFRVQVPANARDPREVGVLVSAF